MYGVCGLCGKDTRVNRKGFCGYCDKEVYKVGRDKGVEILRDIFGKRSIMPMLLTLAATQKPITSQELAKRLGTTYLNIYPTLTKLIKKGTIKKEGEGYRYKVYIGDEKVRWCLANLRFALLIQHIKSR